MNNPGHAFDYLLEKIGDAKMSDVPFLHVEIKDFLTLELLDTILTDRQIALGGAAGTEELLDDLDASGYEVIRFPGAITSRNQYLNLLKGFRDQSAHVAATPGQTTIATEGFGIVYRLARYDSPILVELNEFFGSGRLKRLLVDKFGIRADVQVDAGIQKYLHGYEISPHPDIRAKALTWMLNLNPGVESQDVDFHTHYMHLKDQWRFISEFWRHNQDVERCWLPWDWCKTVVRQSRNNSIVIFSPADDTIHAVKANYDHLNAQRTQAYGNLWYDAMPLKNLDFTAFDLKQSARAGSAG
jgi:hypothetical protein